MKSLSDDYFQGQLGQEKISLTDVSLQRWVYDMLLVTN